MADKRSEMRAFWEEHSSTATLEAMMLDSQAAAIDQEERPEVLGMLGSVRGKRVLELGAGIGRFTAQLAEAAESVVAVDFMQHLIDENRRANGARGNVTFLCKDATTLELKPGSVDVVFSNWLLMYLTDEEVSALITRALGWLGEGGTAFFRESCFRQSGDRQRRTNPTQYRNPRDYFALFDGAQVEAGGRAAHYELVFCKCVDSYVRIKQNQNQVCWKWRRAAAASPRSPLEGSRAFLDAHQYSTRSILRYERIFGAGYVSTGGGTTTEAFVESLQLQAGERVLDVGCGIGGGDFYMSQRYGVYVHGMDLSVNMVLIALERAAEAEHASKVSFEVADVMTCEGQPEAYNVVYSRDTFLHIHDKPALFKRLWELLRPGGRLLISDYCRSPGDPSPEFGAYIQQRGYDLHSVAAYGRLLEGVGFAGVQAEDRTWQFKECLERELAAAERGRAAYEADFSPQDYTEVVGGWRSKLERVERGEQRWGLFTARKPQ